MDNVNNRRSFDRRKNNKKQKARRTSIFYYDHSEGGGNGGGGRGEGKEEEEEEKTEVKLDKNSTPSVSSPTDISISKKIIFDFKRSQSSGSTNSSLLSSSSTTALSNKSSSLHITLSINSPTTSELSEASYDSIGAFSTSSQSSSSAAVFDKRDSTTYFNDQLMETPLINNNNEINGNIEMNVNSSSDMVDGNNVTMQSSSKLNYVNQLKLKFEKMYNSTNDETTNKDEFKKKSSLRRHRRKLSDHIGKVFPWTYSNSDDKKNFQQKINQDDQDIDEIFELSDCEEISENVLMKNNDRDLKNVRFNTDMKSESYKKNIILPEIEIIDFTDESNLIDKHSNKINMKNKNDKKCKKGKLKIDQNCQKKSLNRPKTEIFEIKPKNLWVKSHSYHPEEIETVVQESDTTPTPSDDEHQHSSTAAIEDLRKQFNFSITSNNVPPIIEELLRTEENYVHNLRKNLQSYGGIFDMDDLPRGLKGKKFVLFGNIEQIFEFHETVLLPMLQSNRGDLKQMFDEFLTLVEENHFNAYIMYTMNKKKSLNLSEQYSTFFKDLQEKLDDKLGVNSFLVQPIQRLARYPLLLQEFYKTCFGDIKYKQTIASCCKVEKKMRNLLNIVNECEEVNDIEECFDINIFYQGQFKKVNEFKVYDHTAKAWYRSKVFMFEKSLIYTEIKDKRLIYRGHYPCDLIGFLSKQKSFTLYYEKRKQQECDFEADSNILDLWINLIREMIQSYYVIQEKKKLQEKYLATINKNQTETHLRPKSEIVILNNKSSSRFSADSGIGGMGGVSIVEECSPKTTWYDTL